MAAIGQRHSGVRQWLSGHSSDGRNIDRRNFEGAIQALSIPNVHTWRGSVGQLYDAIEDAADCNANKT